MKTELLFPMNERQIAASETQDYVLAGLARFTLRNATTQARFTFQVRKHKKENIFFVAVLTGGNNESDYTFLGTYFADNKSYRHSAKSGITKDAISAKAAEWIFEFYLYDPARYNLMEFYHEGCCARCGRTLTTPESIISGIGPECMKMMKAKKLGGK